MTIGHRWIYGSVLANTVPQARAFMSMFKGRGYRVVEHKPHSPNEIRCVTTGNSFLIEYTYRVETM